MYLLLTDETNKEESTDVRFFIYGGLFIPADKAGHIHNEIETARRKFGYTQPDLLKFNTNARPKHVSQADATALKAEVIATCTNAGCKFSALIIHHKIAAGQPPDNRCLWAANHVIGHFNYFLLTDANDYGICLIDSLPVKAPNHYLANLFSRGLEIDGGAPQRLDRIVAVATTCIGASHLSSAIDVILGTFRYCINNPRDDPKVKAMLCSVARMMWYSESGSGRFVAERGLIVRPKVVKVRAYQADYDALIKQMEKLIKDI
jgi:hypothetical protein